ncbi:secondary thiamine-phosphate synthase enzyme YjbQ [uncultured Shewanella sp.]|uniref:secondary thiamine-phosphate synthase enzyme YjbQ n=1 Tax=uncultured Shewanella sp. TaxID=173975 RepID=UPI0026182D37|nr:secondary thiamine-phosphate synthase enzyme YjbQ [uncultured Shewanella sp.]
MEDIIVWIQKEINIKAKKRGFHLITEDILSALPELKQLNIGVLHLFIKHTSASIALNENADPSVRHDLEKHFNVLAPENASYYKHTFEGPDDMPAHIKSTLIGVSQSIPVKSGSLNMGIWQGIYLCEHRDRGSSRTLVLTLNGE